MSMVRVAFLGFGNVGLALHALLERRRETLERDYDIEYVVTGIASRRIGWCADPAEKKPGRIGRLSAISLHDRRVHE